MRFIFILAIILIITGQILAFGFFGKCVTDSECKDDQFCDHTGINPIGIYSNRSNIVNTHSVPQGLIFI